MDAPKREGVTSTRMYGLFVSYYEDHFRRAFEGFERFVCSLGSNCALTVICNNPSNRLPGAVAGDNTNWEFSGWDAGLATLGDFGQHDLLVFCNDTFTNHRPWGWSDRRRFADAFARLAASGRQGMCGEVHGYKQPFEILGLSCDRWVSTYLFALTGGLVNRLGRRLSLGEDVLARIAPGIGEAGIVWGDGISDGLKKHLDEWVFPYKAGTGWYKAASASEETKLRKVKTVLNEKYLAAWCVANGGVMMNAGPGFLLRKVREIKGRYFDRALLGR